MSNVATNNSDAEMIASIIAPGHAMQLKVLAEGVETEQQLRSLQQQGCDEAQGYYYSEPVTADEFERLLFGHHENAI